MQGWNSPPGGTHSLASFSFLLWRKLPQYHCGRAHNLYLPHTALVSHIVKFGVPLLAFLITTYVFLPLGP